MVKFKVIGDKDQPLKVGGKVLNALNEFINQVAGEDGVIVEIENMNTVGTKEDEQKGH